jgi:hypothetical protein
MLVFVGLRLIGLWRLPRRPAGRTRSMWGPVVRCTSCRAGCTGSMNAAKCAAEFLHHVAERRFERRAASDQDVIVPGAKRRGRREPDELAQAAPHPVAFDGIADLLGDGEANSGRSGRRPRPCLQHEGVGVRSRALPGSLGDGPKVTPAFQALHITDFEVTKLRVTDSRRVLQSKCYNRCATEKPGRPQRGVTRVAFRHLASCAPVHDARLKPCGRPCSPCGCENRGAACAPVCSADKSVSRDVLRCAACRGDAPRLARLIREGFRPVNVTSPPFVGILAGVRKLHRRRDEAWQNCEGAI